MNLSQFGQIILSVSLNSIAQILLRRGLKGSQIFSLEPVQAIGAILANPWVWGGMFCFALSILIWMAVLSKVPVSVAYPFNSIGFVLTAIVGFVFLGEAVGLQRVLGTIFICIGVIFIGRSA